MGFRVICHRISYPILQIYNKYLKYNKNHNIINYKNFIIILIEFAIIETLFNKIPGRKKFLK